MAATEVRTDGIVFYDCIQEPFSVYGLIHTLEGFVRMPQEVADRVAANVNEGISFLNKCTAGGRVRFVTDSKEIAIRVSMRNLCKMVHFPLTGSVGLDMYADKRYIGTFFPPIDIEDGYEAKLGFEDIAEREITINLPLYGGVCKLEIGLCEGASLKKAKEYRKEKPIVYYGSSITQGGCASRPGNSYESIIARKINCNFVNLGFSGSAKGEKEVAEYIAGLDMTTFVMDYSYNAPNLEHLQKTHEPFFKIIRAKNPTLPIVIVSSPQSNLNDANRAFHKVIRQTYLNAVNDGDEYVAFVDGGKMFDIFGGDSCTVDNCHPNDMGFMCMAEAIGNAICRFKNI